MRTRRTRQRQARRGPARHATAATSRRFRGTGWRIAAAPLLVLALVVTVLHPLARTGTDVGEVEARLSESAHGSIPLLDGGVHGTREGHAELDAPPSPNGGFPVDLPTGHLPDGGAYTTDGSGQWRIVPGGTEPIGAPGARVFRYTVEIEEGVDATSYGGDEAFARMVDATLANPKSWTGDPRFGFQRISDPAHGEPDFRVSLTAAMTVREMCGYTIQLEVSCYNPIPGRVIVNDARWVRGAVPFQGDIGSYRQYVINHEVGHAIGCAAHVPCDAEGGLAHVMMQQTLSVANDDIAQLDPHGDVPADGLACRYNPWPFPQAP
ncbi:DUF3152 domain-containing protein [Hoyosella sp. G463]|uniref:DUF3152 domain-containing protein n=1 Tax=Lolliginicoccus lacisalsi TaxID=2742202 RepID=A0A927PLC1_9ACTN|nr:DUF3152 domain-containing protein [Lolliginicoccus lacisalsi]MBD8506643.1 DUF3152 domain-containing protein [Lolliginicoccus lacisalsi]